MKNNLNAKILKAIQKGLNEALSNYDLTILDDEDDSVLVKNSTYKHQSAYDDIIDRNMSEFLNNDEIFKETVEKMILVDRQYTVKDKEELKTLVKKSVKIFGNECNLNWLDTNLITNMSNLFYGMKDFNGHIENWDVSNVKDMTGMFFKAESFNQPIGNWDVSNVENMYSMFFEAKSFNQPIKNWNVSNVKYISYIFFNCPIKESYKPKNSIIV